MSRLLSCWPLFCLLIARSGMAGAPLPPVTGDSRLGPGQIPCQLFGLWRVSVCCKKAHTWIRYENVDTGEVHSISRFKRGAGQLKDECTGETIVPGVCSSGLWWDQDLRFEPEVRNGQFLLISVLIKDPLIYQSHQQDGYRLRGNNCTSYVAEAWAFYSGEKYCLPGAILPRRLGKALWRRHPDIPIDAALKGNSLFR